MALVVEEWPVSRLRDYEKNPRRNDHAIPDMIANLTEFGFRIPVLARSDGAVIDGHLRLKAARTMGMETVPVALADDLTPTQVRAFRLAVNKSATWADWDDGLLLGELSALEAEGFDLSLTGFGSDELNDLLASQTDGLTDPDDVPPVPEISTSRLSDVWLLGRHRLCCGDSTNPESVNAVLAGVRPHLMVTDPPYGVEYAADWRDKALGGKQGGRATGRVENDGSADWSEAWALFPGDVAYVWCAPGPLNVAAHDSLASAGYEPRMQIVWAKSQFAIGRGYYHCQHENCWYAVRKGATGHWQGDRKQSTLWQIDKPIKSETGHSTQKPVECMKRPIENNSSPGQAVYEPFSGSGTTIIAGEMTGRIVLAIELSPGYVDVAVRRWETFTGHQATLEATGQSLTDVRIARTLATEDAGPA